MPETKFQAGHIHRRDYNEQTLQSEATKTSQYFDDNSQRTTADFASEQPETGSLPKVTHHLSTDDATQNPALTPGSTRRRRQNSIVRDLNARVSITYRDVPSPKLLEGAEGAQETREELELGSNQESSQQYFSIPDLPEGKNVFPSVAFGDRQTTGLSKIGRAEHEIKMWEDILAHHQKEIPELAPVCQLSLDRARAARLSLEPTEENLRVGVQNPGEVAIKKRLDTLQWALDKSKFGPFVYLELLEDANTDRSSK